MSVAVTDQSPAPGETVARLDALTFTVLHDALSDVVVSVSYPDGRTEIVFSAGSFSPVYRAASTINNDGGSTIFTICRSAGWDDAPTLVVDEAAAVAPGWGYPWGNA